MQGEVLYSQVFKTGCTEEGKVMNIDEYMETRNLTKCLKEK
jgi:hypothetical protein